MKKEIWIAAVALVATAAGLVASKMVHEGVPPARVLRCTLTWGSAARDFDNLCAAGQAIAQLRAQRGGGERSMESVAQENAVILNAMDGFCSRAAIESTRVVGSVEPEQKYQLLRAAAEDAGVHGWSCPALEALFR